MAKRSSDAAEAAQDIAPATEGPAKAQVAAQEPARPDPYSKPSVYKRGDKMDQLQEVTSG